MALIADRCRRALAIFHNTESLTVVMVTGSSRELVAAQLGVDLDVAAEEGWNEEEGQTAWAIQAVPGGVLAMEITGYGDPAGSVLGTLSADGRKAAVMRSNIMAHVRFGCALDGQLVFDDDEFRYYVDDQEAVPDDLRPLFAEADAEDWTLVGFALAERFTGIEVAPESVELLQESGFYAAPSGGFIDELVG